MSQKLISAVSANKKATVLDASITAVVHFALIKECNAGLIHLARLLHLVVVLVDFIAVE